AMCHLGGLPGRPRHDVAGGIDAVVEALRADVAALQDAGVDGLLFCNENDLPYLTRVGTEVATAMTAAVTALRPEIRLPFGVDLLLISGQAAGVGADMADLREAKEAVTRIPVVANTGVNHETVSRVLGLVDGAIVGTSLKVDGNTWNPVDGDRAARMVELVA